MKLEAKGGMGVGVCPLPYILTNEVLDYYTFFANHPMVRANPPKINEILYDGKTWNI